MDRTKLKQYIERVIDDSCKAENRVNDCSFSAYILDGDVLFFLFRCRYDRVRRRVMYRLDHNLHKNFGLSLVVDDWRWESETDQNPPFYIRDHYVEAGYTVAEVVEQGKRYFVFVSAIGRKSDILPEDLRKHPATTDVKTKMESIGGRQYYYEDLSHAYETCRQDYKNAYGVDMPQIQVEKL